MIPYALLISLLTSTLIPAVSSLVSRQHWPTEITALITVILAAVSGFAAQAASAGDFHLNTALLYSLLTYVIAAVARSQFWRGTTTDAKLLAVGSKKAAA